jgi:hypothetical protein
LIERKMIPLLLLLLLIVSVMVVVVVYQAVVVGPMFTFTDESTRIEVKWRTYHPGDKVYLTVFVEEPIRVAIVSVEMNSSIVGLENRTLFSGGSAWWGSKLVYDPNRKDADAEECDFDLPGSWAWDLQIENKPVKVYFTIKVTYVHARDVGSGYFENAYDTKLITCYMFLDVEVP